VDGLIHLDGLMMVPVMSNSCNQKLMRLSLNSCLSFNMMNLKVQLKLTMVKLKKQLLQEKLTLEMELKLVDGQILSDGLMVVLTMIQYLLKHNMMSLKDQQKLIMVKLKKLLLLEKPIQEMELKQVDGLILLDGLMVAQMMIQFLPNFHLHMMSQKDQQKLIMVKPKKQSLLEKLTLEMVKKEVDGLILSDGLTMVLTMIQFFE
jgi:hypothetical protein